MVNIALVYDRATVTYGGAEQVVLALQQAYPQAIFYTSLFDQRKARWVNKQAVRTTFLQQLPFAKYLHRYLAALMPFAFESLNLSTFDIIISVTSAEAKGVITNRKQLHICYLLSPPRYLYHYHNQYLQQNFLLKLPIIKQCAALALTYLRNWDQQAIFRPDLLIPIAKVVKKRAATYYPQAKTEPVIYPPLQTSWDMTLPIRADLQDLEKQAPYYLLVARLVPYKHVDAAIRACQKLGKPLRIVGDGPEALRLHQIADKKYITFYKELNQTELAMLYMHATAVLSPGLDDFSLTALEANLFGKPVVINQLAGAAEIIKHGKHGLHCRYALGNDLETYSHHLQDSLELLAHTHFDPKQLEQNARKYGTNEFVRQFRQAVDKAYQAKLEGII
jgi:glycosyltransferase involved in cell wall biosynthesis